MAHQIGVDRRQIFFFSLEEQIVEDHSMVISIRFVPVEDLPWNVNAM